MNDQAKPTETLQFDQAQFEQGAVTNAKQCASCNGALGARYWLVNEHVVCEGCSRRVQDTADSGSSSARFATAAVLGLAAGAVGAGIWYAIVKLTGYEIGLIAIVVGYLVGAAVRKGSAGHGGFGYQALAVLITYAAVTLNYVPMVLAGIDAGTALGPLQYVLVVGIAAAAPFLALPKNIIGVLIIGFAVYQAWNMNKRATLVLKGPFEIAGST